MLLRLAVFAMMALGLAGFGMVAWLALSPPPPSPAAIVAASETPPPPPAPVRHMVLAAALPLQAGTLLKPEDLQAKDVADPPPGAQADLPAVRAALVGGMLRRNLAPNEALLATDVMRPGSHGFLAAVLAPGHRAASVAVDAVSGSAGLIWPGDRVDLILTQALDDPALPAARKVAAETILSDVRVIAIDQLLASGVAPPTGNMGQSRTVTLEVTAPEAERIAVATRLGKLSLAVRAAEDLPAAVIAARALTTWGGDVSPALGSPVATAATGTVLRVYHGAADGKEFRF